MPNDRQEASSFSDSSTSRRVVHSDEEVLLATSFPKKRAGRRIFRETRHPVFRGVRKRNGNKWVCEMREPNKKSRIWLGTYPTPEMAARAHDVAALALRGKSACLNFADSAWRLPVPVSKDSKDITRAANEAAELFRPQEFGGHPAKQQDSNAEAVFDMPAELFRPQEFGGHLAKQQDSNTVLEDYSSEVCSDDYKTFQENDVFFEEAVFDMPGLLVDMAEGLLLSPPRYVRNDGNDLDHMENGSDFSLWSY
uniref:Dehydration-responsive element binding factor n=1 Tax=Populus nigra TaxID=3691 RepID=X2JRI3_POPNI|nr:dehydration-responsive element binding factor [Populus nigra]AHN65443.1 dehydration-responsive element binding protein [Populus nigra]AHN65450.1 dehydration-responsive element binding protein [Populus nigra]AHN65452.1 dehydration-responsive element binding protein [Populus nigra]AHN65454.1 dehydration-responsive element binding protein [Populus nigra]